MKIFVSNFEYTVGEILTLQLIIENPDAPILAGEKIYSMLGIKAFGGSDENNPFSGKRFLGWAFLDEIYEMNSLNT